ncbi:hypothetical protein GCM10020221_01380 [Streptomyces thioluteus]|uniref:Uncharacterized protein n=1 Tax=Streptomyces thioluteus TaxID=66431 RepID=A0ABN3WDD8_STRTU
MIPDLRVLGVLPAHDLDRSKRIITIFHGQWDRDAHALPLREHTPSLVNLGDGDPVLLAEVTAVVRQVAAAVLAEHGAARVTTNLGEYQEPEHWSCPLGASGRHRPRLTRLPVRAAAQHSA